MQPSLSEKLTQQFYDWEKRGRGWQLFATPIHVEPVFTPFFFHIPQRKSVIDDGKRPTWISSFLEAVGGAKKKVLEEETDTSIRGYTFESLETLNVFMVSLPQGTKINGEQTAHFLQTLGQFNYPVSFEIIGTYSSITIQLVCRESDALQVVSQTKAYFPECSITEQTDHIQTCVANGRHARVLDFGLRDEFMRPVVMTDDFTIDPFIGIVGTLENIQEDESVVLQILFQGAQSPWAESVMRSVIDMDGDSFFADAPEMVALAKEKISSPLFGVVMRIVSIGNSAQNVATLSTTIEKSFVRIYNSPWNSLIPLTNEVQGIDSKMNDVLLRQSCRLGMLLNTQELATIVHFPSVSVVSSKLIKDTRKTKVAPLVTNGHEFVLGKNRHQGKEKEVTITSSQRLKHTHVIGATGTGKSTMLLHHIAQDIALGNGVAVLDPHGDLIENILPHIPEHRRKDVLIIDPSDRDFPVGFNFLTAHSEIEKDILSSDLVAVFKRLSTSWGDQMNSVLANAILAFLESSQGGTMIDLRRFLVEKRFREDILKTVQDPSVRYYWQKEYPLLKSSSIGSILTRLDSFLRPKLIRNMVAQRKGIDFEHLLDQQKIVLVKLSQGLIGNENSYLLGTIIVSKIHQAAMTRKAKEERKNFFIYIDEFQNFITPSMSAILSGARKYHVGLVLAHQDMQQLVKYDTELASSVVSNAATRICFRLGDTDAKRFESGFSSFERMDLESLNTGQAIARIERPDADFSLETIPLPTMDIDISAAIKEEVIALSRATYASHREDVEAQLMALSSDMQEQEVEDTSIVEKPRIIPPKPVVRSSSIPTPPIEIDYQESAEKVIKQKEQSQHRHLQAQIKRMAESKGFKAVIEAPTSDGKGRVDIAIERNGKNIAIEICMTTEKEWEVHNIEKCLADVYDVVISCSTDIKTIMAIKSIAATTLTPEQQEKVLYFVPEQIDTYLDGLLAKENSKETRIKGYRVKVEYDSVVGNVAEQKKNTILKALSDSENKKRG